MVRKIALYIHIPFCRRRCGYCSFVSYSGHEGDYDAYIAALRRELEQRAYGEEVTSIYFGGGTPSLLDAGQIGVILDDIRGLFSVNKTIEITIEANPGTVSTAFLSSIRVSGVNRLSLGIQSFRDAELARLGRIHNVRDAIQAVALARSAGFDNINLDLIYGIPGQNLDDWRDTLTTALEMRPEHLSLYGLTLEEGTPLQQEIKRGKLPVIDPDLSADQYELAEDLLGGRGYRHYEISNWAEPGRECRHNLACWEGRPYIGIGVAAHSWYGGHRTANTRDLDEYLVALTQGRMPSLELDEEINPATQLAEAVILGLRLGEGIDINDFHHRFEIDIAAYYPHQINEMEDYGLLEKSGGRLRLTRRGRLLSNEVFWRFLPDESGAPEPVPLAREDVRH